MTDSASCSALSAARCSSSPLAIVVLQRRHLGHQRGRLGLVLGALGLADLLRRRIAPRLRLLQPRHHLAPRLVERDQLVSKHDVAGFRLSVRSMPRFPSPASNACGLSLIHLMSNTALASHSNVIPAQAGTQVTGPHHFDDANARVGVSWVPAYAANDSAVRAYRRGRWSVHGVADCRGANAPSAARRCPLGHVPARDRLPAIPAGCGPSLGQALAARARRPARAGVPACMLRSYTLSANDASRGGAWAADPPARRRGLRSARVFSTRATARMAAS